MVVPDYQRLMLPLLRIAGDGREHDLDDAIEALAREFRLNDDDRKELLPSGRQPRFRNRVGWARTYLTKAGLLMSAGRGKFRITERGLDALREQPAEINNQYLKRFPEFLEFQSLSHQDNRAGNEETDSGQTPEEILEAG